MLEGCIRLWDCMEVVLCAKCHKDCCYWMCCWHTHAEPSPGFAAGSVALRHPAGAQPAGQRAAALRQQLAPAVPPCHHTGSRTLTPQGRCRLAPEGQLQPAAAAAAAAAGGGRTAAAAAACSQAAAAGVAAAAAAAAEPVRVPQRRRRSAAGGVPPTSSPTPSPRLRSRKGRAAGRWTCATWAPCCPLWA